MAREPFEAPGSVKPDFFLAAAIAVSMAGYGSNELIRDQLGIGFERASRLIEALQNEGILGYDLDDNARLELLRPIGFY